MKKISTLIILFVLLCVYPSPALDNLPGSYAGTEFYFSFPAARMESGENNSIKLYICSPVRTGVRVDVESVAFSEQKFVEAGGTTEILLPAALVQPVYTTDQQAAPAEKIYQDQAIHIVAETPVFVYAIAGYNKCGEGFAVLPLSALGTKYIVATGADGSDNTTSFAPSQTLVTAAFDNTQLTFTLGGNLMTETAGGLKSGSTLTVQLNRGDVWAVASKGSGADLSGSVIESSRPVAVVSGNYCARVPMTTENCNFVCDMETPVQYWGTSYLVPKLQGRLTNAFVRIVASEPDTKIYRNGQQIGVLQTSGGSEGTGFLDRRISDGEPDAFVLSADKPIAVTMLNTAGDDDGTANEPFQMPLLPTGQNMTSAMFSVPGTASGSDFSNHYLAVIFETDGAGELPLDMEIASVDGSVLQWQAVAVKYGSFFNPYAGDIEGRQYGHKMLQLLQPGIYSIRSSTPFVVYAYGSAPGKSYGFPLAGMLTAGSASDMLPPVPVYTRDTDGNVADGMVSDLPEDDIARSNLSAVYLVPEQSRNYRLTTGSFMPGIDQQTTWRLHVVDTMRSARAVVRFVDRAGNDTTIVVTGKRQPALISAEDMDFGRILIGSTLSRTLQIHNVGDEPLTLTALSEPAHAAFRIDPISFPLVVPPGGSTPVQVRFTPTAQQLYVDEITAWSDAEGTDPLLHLVGEGVPEIVGVEEERRRPTLHIRPNPVSSEAILRYTLAMPSDIHIAVYSMLGEEMEVFDEKQKAAGEHELSIDTRTFSTGLYRCRIVCGEQAQDIPFVVVR